MQRIYLRLSALLLTGFFFAGLLRAQIPDPVFTQAQAQAWLDEVAPVLKEISQRAPQHAPVVLCVTEDELAQVLADEFKAYLNRINPGYAANDMLAEFDAAFLARAMLGKYAPQRRQILLMPNNFSRIGRKLDLSAEQIQSLVKVVLLHELTHWLQDEIVGLQQRITAHTDVDSHQALMAAVEGQAVLFHELAAAELGLGEAAEHLSYILPGGGYLRDHYSAYSQQLDSTKIFSKVSYNYGPAYMRRIYEDGGVEATWQALGDAPVDLNVILTARSEEHDGKDFVKRLQGVEKLFSEAPWEVKALALDKAAMLSQFDHLSPEKREEMLKAIQSVTAVIAGQKVGKEPRMLILSVMVLTDASQQQTVRELMASNLERQKQLYSQRGIAIELTERNFSLPGEVLVTESNLNITADGQSSDQFYFSMMIRGDIAIQCLFIGFPQPSDAQYAGIAERVFDE